MLSSVVVESSDLILSREPLMLSDLSQISSVAARIPLLSLLLLLLVLLLVWLLLGDEGCDWRGLEM
jgi:hypothetical protein